MFDAINRIETYTSGFDWLGLEADTRTQDAVIRNLEVVGEAARNVLRHNPAFVAVPWGKAYRMRNALSHEYAELDLEVIWRTPQVNLPPLEAQIAALLTNGSQRISQAPPPRRKRPEAQHPGPSPSC
jgi:uncharacterized protein with HEPN domain